MYRIFFYYMHLKTITFYYLSSKSPFICLNIFHSVSFLYKFLLLKIWPPVYVVSISGHFKVRHRSVARTVFKCKWRDENHAVRSPDCKEMVQISFELIQKFLEFFYKQYEDEHFRNADTDELYWWWMSSAETSSTEKKKAY